MRIGASTLLNQYGSGLNVAKALLEGKIRSYEEEFVSDIVTNVIMEAAKFQLEQQKSVVEKNNKKGFWDTFHTVWSNDRGNGERHPGYDKKAWIYVQSKLEAYFRKPQ